MKIINKVQGRLWVLLVTISIAAGGQTIETKTSAVNSCVESNLYKTPQSFENIENELIALNLLKDKSARNYKELFCIYQPEYINGTEQHYRNKQKIAAIFQSNLKGSEEALMAMQSCMQESMSEEIFQQTKTGEFLLLYTAIKQKLASGNIPKEWEEIESIPSLYKLELPENIFENDEVRLSAIFVLNKYLKNYSMEDMELEIRRSKPRKAKEEIEKKESIVETVNDELEIIVIEGDGNSSDNIIIEETSVED